MSDKFEFAGIYEHPFKMPGFLNPVFETPDKRHVIQVVGEDEKIAHFIEYEDLRGDNLLRAGEFPVNYISEAHNLHAAYARRAGDDALICVRFIDRDIVLADPASMRHILRLRLDEFKTYPAIHLVLSDFVGDDLRLSLAKAMVEDRNAKLREERMAGKMLFSQFEDLMEQDSAGTQEKLERWLKQSADDDDSVFPRIFKKKGRAAIDRLASGKAMEMLHNALDNSMREVLEKNQNLSIFGKLAVLAGITNCTSALDMIESTTKKSIDDDDSTLMNTLMESINNFPHEVSVESANRLAREQRLRAADSWPMIGPLIAETDPEHFPQHAKHYNANTSLRSPGDLNDLLRSLETDA